MSRRYYYHDFPYYPPATPIAVKGGIKAQSQRGKFSQHWWAQRWISVLESFNIGARLGRGRAYARQGQVRSIDIQQGMVTAEVQGTQRKPYDIFISIKTLTLAQWKKLAEVFASQAIFAARLLTGEMPENIEDAFRQLNLSLFPEKQDDLHTECSCPDWSNPCKHIAAVYYLLGEEFDRDPFLIFKLRGITREELIELMNTAFGGSASLSKPGDFPTSDINEEPLTPEPIPPDEKSFWDGGDLSDDIFGAAIIPRIAAALPKRLGNFPFWRGEKRFIETITSIYSQASKLGVDAFLGYFNASDNKSCS